MGFQYGKTPQWSVTVKLPLSWLGVHLVDENTWVTISQNFGKVDSDSFCKVSQCLLPGCELTAFPTLWLSMVSSVIDYFKIFYRMWNCFH